VPVICMTGPSREARPILLRPTISIYIQRMQPALRIRPVTRLDYEQWLPLWNGYNAFYGRSGATALPIETTRTTWERFFDAY
jgi:hypothetical protein